MKTKDLYLNFNYFSILFLTDGINNMITFVKSLLLVLLIALTAYGAYIVLSFVYTIVVAVFSFVVANFAGILLAIVLIAALKKVILR